MEKERTKLADLFKLLEAKNFPQPKCFKKGLVSHCHPHFIDANLRTPNPRRLAQHAGVGHGRTNRDKKVGAVELNVTFGFKIKNLCVSKVVVFFSEINFYMEWQTLALMLWKEKGLN